IPKQFTNIINTICNDENLPHKLLITKMVSIPKKTIVYKCEDIRGIRIKSSLLSVIDRLVLRRLFPLLDNNIHKEQNGFMKKRGIEDNIIILRTILYNRKYIEKKHYYLTLLDIHKAFDSDNNTILQTIHKYCNKWKLQINKDKSVIASNKKKIINETSIRDNPLQIQNTNNTIKYLGIIFDSITLSWKKHVDDRVEKANTAISQSHLIGVLGGGLDHSTQIKYYRSIIRPVIEFGLRIMLLGNSHLRKLNTMQQRALTIIIMKEEYQYVLTKIHRYAKNIKEGKKVPPAVNMEAFKILVDIDLLNYWYFPPTYLTEKEWKVMIKKKIYRKDYENDIRELENKIDNQPLLQVLKECNSDMEPGIPLINEIKKRIKDVDDEVLNKIIKVLSGNPKFSWKNGKENGITIRKWKSCIWCKKEWENPIQHVLYDCEVHLSVRNKIREEQKKDQEKIILNGIFSINGLAKFCKEAFKENAMI
ncbi:hypothetical protein RFI_34439, partial [Reticulomyxa filosa]